VETAHRESLRRLHGRDDFELSALSKGTHKARRRLAIAVRSAMVASSTASPTSRSAAAASEAAATATTASTTASFHDAAVNESY